MLFTMAVLIKRCGIILPGFKATSSCLTVVLLICLETVLLCTESTCSKSFHVHWNTTNSIFRIDNTDHIIDVNKGNVQFEYDQVNIICPVYTPGTFDEDAEKYIIYNVSKEEYETCRITNPNPRIIAICDKPHKLMYFTITFRPFTPQPGGLEFQPGKDYYFISTSSKEDLHRRIGGRCDTNNMKIVFKVCCAPETGSNTTSKAGTSTTAINWPVRPSTRPTTTTTTTQIARTESTSTRKPTKKIVEYEKHPNEVVKNEELTYSKGVLLSAAPSSFFIVAVCIAVIRWR
ncbi:PREDICTED: ephrin-B2-like [Nicrophorus vespilloides]|uniref:Ephrin-B2-like n=1 Tax=Nicrophorus vespilloides TaxID=110193 RepID=A0ABM1MG65_NICVS|nr:PREDICTED: ephrin-B2-like [Nicrophorus vespilloides]